MSSIKPCSSKAWDKVLPTNMKDCTGSYWFTLYCLWESVGRAEIYNFVTAHSWLIMCCHLHKSF